MSVTNTAVPTGRANAEAAERVKVEPDPYTIENTSRETNDWQYGDEAASPSKTGFLRNVESAVRRDPIATLALVAIVSFVFGATR